MRIKFWGTRGSIPTPSTSDFVTNRYGGNTTCVSVHIPGQLVILDAGSGLRNLGLDLSHHLPIRATFFFSHVHWDHIQGFPFFPPSFDEGSSFDLYGRCHGDLKAFGGSTVANALLLQQQSLNFPVSLEEMGAQLNFFRIQPGDEVVLEGEGSRLRISAHELNHPGGCYGYRIEEHRGKSVKVFGFATDTEHLAENNPCLQSLARDAEVLFYDAQYTPEEYRGQAGTSRRNWGHSTWKHGLREAQAAGVKRLLLTHHDPLHDDWAIARIETDARREGRKMGIQVEAAREAMEIEL